MRLIDADTLKEMICNNIYPITNTFNSQDYGMVWTGGIEKAIDEAPTIDAEPIRHGHWVKENEEDTLFRFCVYKCSLCGGEVLSEAYLFKYCPYCGCAIKMEVEEDE